ncbi:hypothetical protein AURDEDRAFT_116294 [Auricularia subglabra TFB-10046 SS5]|nr:hypothetical protein AURDEDRAFT_116294 [Auricularia subglabra TFB-10046 SS5]
MKLCAWKANWAVSDHRLLLAVRDVCTVTIQDVHPDELAVAISHLTPPFVFTFTLDSNEPEALIELTVEEHARPEPRSRTFLDDRRRWVDHRDSALIAALSVALAGKAHTLVIDASYLDTFLQRIGPIPGAQCLRIRLSEGSDLQALSSAKYPAGTVRALEILSSRCIELSDPDAVVEIFGRAESREITLSLQNVHALSSEALLRDTFKNFTFRHDDASCHLRAPHVA